MRKEYSAKDLTLIVPTKDRPEKIADLLNSLALQTVSCRRIIIVDGGESVEHVVMPYQCRLPVEYYRCVPPGQIRQRNYAYTKLTDSDILVGLLDDDLVLEPDAVEKMLDCWNSVESSTAGISFNIINSVPFRHSWLRHLAGMGSKEMGRVLRSGYNVPISPVDQDIRAEWLCGGATVWKKEILEEYKNRDIRTAWAICEDLIFSYPIGKERPLYVSASARVRHEHVYDHKSKKKHVYYGRNNALWRFYFVESNQELSRMHYSWMVLCQVIARIATGVICRRVSDVQFAGGQLHGLAIGFMALLKGKTILSVIDES